MLEYVKFSMWVVYYISWIDSCLEAIRQGNEKRNEHWIFFLSDMINDDNNSKIQRKNKLGQEGHAESFTQQSVKTNKRINDHLFLKAYHT